MAVKYHLMVDCLVEEIYINTTVTNRIKDRKAKGIKKKVKWNYKNNLIISTHRKRKKREERTDETSEKQIAL